MQRALAIKARNSDRRLINSIVRQDGRWEGEVESHNRPMKPVTKRWVKGVTLGFAYSMLGSLVFMRFIRGRPEMDSGDWITALCVSALLTAGMGMIEGQVLPRTWRMSFMRALAVRSAAYILVIVVTIFFGVFAVNVLSGGWPKAIVRFHQLMFESNELRRGVLYSFAVVPLYSFLSGISQKLGPGVLMNWILGRYHDPKVEQRIFMFLDLKDSTGLAVELGNVRFSRLVRDFFRDMTEPLLRHQATVSHYIGDEVVISWPMRKGLVDGNCVRCFFAIQDEITRRSERYQRSYGRVPSFKAGAHCGEVVATDVGYIKSEIVYHGDVLNVAARLEALCNEENADFLISGELASMLPAATGVDMTSLGMKQVRGRPEPLEVLRCEGGSSQPLQPSAGILNPHHALAYDPISVPGETPDDMEMR